MTKASGPGWAIVAIATLAMVEPRAAGATPSTVFWAPSTPALQPYGVLHVTYDTYLRDDAAYPIDAGLTIGALPWKTFQLELGFDLFYPTLSEGEPIDFPILLNAKVGAPEDAYFPGSPGWSAGIFGVGFEEDVTDYDVLYAVLGRTFPRVGTLSAGVYQGADGDLFQSSRGAKERTGLLAAWVSPAIDVPRLDKVLLAWDVQTGENVLGATGGGIYLYFTPTVDLLVGPVFFFDERLQPGGADWMWSIQLDVDVPLTGP